MGGNRPRTMTSRCVLVADPPCARRLAAAGGSKSQALAGGRVNCCRVTRHFAEEFGESLIYRHDESPRWQLLFAALGFQDIANGLDHGGGLEEMDLMSGASYYRMPGVG